MSKPTKHSIASELVSASSALNMHVESIAKGQTIAESSSYVRHSREHIQAARELCRDTSTVDKFYEISNKVLEEAGLKITPHKSILDMYISTLESVDVLLDVADRILDMEYYYDGRDGMDVFITDVDPAAGLSVKTLSMAIDQLSISRRLLWRARLVVDRRMALEKAWDTIPAGRWEQFDMAARKVESVL